MPPKPQKQIVFKIESPEAFTELTAAENPRLLVIDFHLAWCGPCNIIEQNYRSLYFAYENAESRIAFYNAEQAAIPQEIYSSLKYGPLTCKPRFAIFIVS